MRGCGWPLRTAGSPLLPSLWLCPTLGGRKALCVAFGSSKLPLGWLYLGGWPFGKEFLLWIILKRRGRILVNVCPMCLRVEETVDHLLLNCTKAQFICRSMVEWLDCSWVFLQSLQDLFQAWKAPSGGPRGKELWKLSFLAVLWTIWKERNSRCFEGASNSQRCLVERTKFLVALWVSTSPLFKDFSIDQIKHHWKEIASYSIESM